MIAGSVQIAGAQELGTYLSEAESLKTLLPTLNDMLAQQYGLDATEEAAVQIGTMIGKVMDGQLGALSRYGYSWTEAQEKVLKFGTEAQRAAMLVEVIGQSVGGMNAALADTPEGKMRQLQAAIGGVREELGREIALPMYNWGVQWLLKAIPTLKKIVTDTLESIKDSIARNKEKFEEIKSTLLDIKNRIFGAFAPGGEGGGALGWFIYTGIPALVTGTANVLRGVTGIYNFIRDNWSLIGPIIYGVVGGVVAYKGALIIANTWNILTTASQKALAWWTTVYGNAAKNSSGKVTILTLAQHGLNAAMRANPIGTIITLLGLLVTAGIYVVENWEEIKLAGMQTWNTIVDAAEWTVNALVWLGNILVQAFVFAWDAIKYYAGITWNWLVDVTQDAINDEIKSANELIKAFQYAWGAIEHGGKSLWNGVVAAAEEGLTWLLGPINKVRKALKMDEVSVDFGSFKIESKMPKWDELGDVIPSVDFGAAKVEVEKPKWDSNFQLIPTVDYSSGKFSEDSLMAQRRKVQEKKGESEGKLADALAANTAAMESNTQATSENTQATGANTSATKANTARLKENLSPMELADSLLGRIERHVWGT
ncbi:hypothetical protein [Paenibacillus sp. 32O-W]|uniref:hypothetical protein n=1 Tax=Paenibacillus sp. 32O-W TaxID=1695218 RepID=UPI00119D13B5|nr:hypothetical protein [Paenibacillus sp. 32O-W]